MKVRLRYFRNRLKAFFRTDKGKALLKWVQRIFNLGILVWLILELADIGWKRVWESLPVHPLFYLLFIGTYLQLPFFEILIYRLTWQFAPMKSVPVFMLKRVYNKDLLGYSGEVYFYLWAKRTLKGLKDWEIFQTIKDNNIISSIASTLISVLLLSIFFFTDQIKLTDWIATQNKLYFWGGGVLIVVAVALFIRFRHLVISMPLKTAYSIFGIQFFRLTLGQLFNVLMYYVVMPEAPLYVWFTLLSAEIILTRIPLLPNRDLIYVGISIGIAEGLAVSTSSIAALMVTRSVLNKVFNFAVFGIGALLKTDEMAPGTQPENSGQLSTFEDIEREKEPDS